MNFAYSNCTDKHIEIDGMCFGFQISNIFFRVYLFEPDRFTFNLSMNRLYFTTYSGEKEEGVIIFNFGYSEIKHFSIKMGHSQSSLTKIFQNRAH